MIQSSGIAIATVHSILVLINIVGNCLVCAIIKKNRDMRTHINYLLVNLAVADGLYATLITPEIFLAFLSSTHPGGMTGTVLCKLLTGGGLAWIAGHSSVVTLVAIAAERYYAVIYPTGNAGRLTKRKLKVIIPGSWIFSLLVNIPVFLTVSVKDNVCMVMYEEWIPKVYLWCSSTIVVIAMAIMTGLYSRIVYTLWFKRDRDNQLTFQQRGVLRVRKRVTLMGVTVAAIFGICWAPDIIAHIIDYFTSGSINEATYAVIHTIVLFSSAVNPFMYALVNKTFREKLKGMIYLTCISSTGSTRVPDLPPKETCRAGASPFK